MRNTPLGFIIERIKTPVLVLVLLTFWSCGNPDTNTKALQAKVDSLNKQVAQAYKPGLGEFMLGIQIHHAKLYFAGKSKNWALAEFEMGEIKEALDDINKYCTDRPEIKSLPILNPAVDSVNNAVKASSPQRFEAGFVLLTGACNSCHQTTHHQFNVIKVPETPPFNNQEFKVK
ncbi:MAG: hypothetical protein ABJA76_06670 [Mucilaginibacter sp.]